MTLTDGRRQNVKLDERNKGRYRKRATRHGGPFRSGSRPSRTSERLVFVNDVICYTPEQVSRGPAIKNDPAEPRRAASAAPEAPGVGNFLPRVRALKTKPKDISLTCNDVVCVNFHQCSYMRLVVE